MVTFRVYSLLFFMSLLGVCLQGASSNHIRLNQMVVVSSLDTVLSESYSMYQLLEDLVTTLHIQGEGKVEVANMCAAIKLTVIPHKSDELTPRKNQGQVAAKKLIKSLALNMHSASLDHVQERMKSPEIQAAVEIIAYFALVLCIEGYEQKNKNESNREYVWRLFIRCFQQAKDQDLISKLPAFIQEVSVHMHSHHQVPQSVEDEAPDSPPMSKKCCCCFI